METSDVASPRRGHGADAVVRVDVIAEGQGDDHEVVLEVVEPHADDLARLVDGGTHVGVLAEAVAAQQLDGERHQLVHRARQVHQHDPRRRPQPRVVLVALEQVELALVGVPVGADALEAGRAVHEGVRHDADARVRQRARRHPRSSTPRPWAWVAQSGADATCFWVSMRASIEQAARPLPVRRRLTRARPGPGPRGPGRRRRSRHRPAAAGRSGPGPGTGARR